MEQWKKVACLMNQVSFMSGGWGGDIYLRKRWHQDVMCSADKKMGHGIHEDVTLRHSIYPKTVADQVQHLKGMVFPAGSGFF